MVVFMNMIIVGKQNKLNFRLLCTEDKRILVSIS